jgi:hypothetical protein
LKEVVEEHEADLVIFDNDFAAGAHIQSLGNAVPTAQNDPRHLRPPRTQQARRNRAAGVSAAAVAPHGTAAWGEPETDRWLIDRRLGLFAN